MTPREHGDAVQRLHDWALAVSDAARIMCAIAVGALVFGLATQSPSPPTFGVAALVSMFALIVVDEVLLLVARWHLRCMKRELERRRDDP